MNIIEEISKLKKKDTRYNDNLIYNQAIEDVINLIKNMEETK